MTRPSTPGPAHTLFVVLNKLEVRASMPLELVKGHFLRQPSDSELPLVRDALRGADGFRDLTLPFEVDRRTGERLERPLGYHVVEVVDYSEFGAVNGGILAIEAAARLTDTELDCPLSIHPGGGMGLAGPNEMDPFRAVDFFGRSPTSLTEEAVANIRQIVADVRRVSPGFPWLASSLDLFRRAVGLPEGHNLQVLGLFAVIESLLTHNPVGRSDSLTHQISTKVPLLTRRFKAPLDLSAFGKIAPEALWKSLYGFRSSIAHGGTLDFKSDKLMPLRDHDTAYRLVRSAAKALLRHSLLEPDLVQDLRAC